MNALAENAGALSPPQIRPLQLIPGCNTPPEITRAQLVHNVERNIKWLEMQPLKTKPLVIVAGGPSLKYRWPEIELHNADVMALNNAYRFLLERDIVPEYFMLLDARKDNIDFLKDYSLSTTHLIAAQCHPDIFQRLYNCNCKTTLYLTVLPGSLELTEHINKPKVLIAGTVGTVGIKALCMAYALGYREIHLYGYDSSYADDEHHAFEQKLNDNANTIEVFLNDKKYITTPTLAHQATEFPGMAAEMIRNYGFSIELHCDGLLPAMVEAANKRGEIPIEQREREKYEAIWSFEKYRKEAPGEYHVKNAINYFKGNNVCDFGCGTGRAAQWLLDNRYFVVGIDHAANCRDPNTTFVFLQACLWDLPPFGVDWGLCTDVMEHIPPEKVDAVLFGIARRVKEGAYFNISTRDDNLGSLIGKKLHLTVITANSWKIELEKHFKIVEMQDRDGEANFICKH